MPLEDLGLSTSEANRLLQKHGPNSLPETPPPGDFSIFLSQLKNPLVYILLFAGLITLVLGHLPDTLIIFFAVIINSILGFIQERRASRALTALKTLIHPTAKVIRDGRIVTLEISSVVPGDIAILEQGSKIPSDGQLLEANRFFVSEAILTGESQPVSKSKGDPVFMGTVVSAGRAQMRVLQTGGQTEIGRIALNVQTPEEDTPLKKQLRFFSKQLTLLVSALTILVFVIGLLVGKSLEEIFITSVALAVSAIPEGLLVGTTVILAFGMQRIVRRKGLVRQLMSAETLGGITTLCVDKTGTLTEGKMHVVKSLGDEKLLVTQAILANDLDDPLTVAAWEWAIKKVKNPKTLVSRYRRVDSLPFSSQHRYFASLNHWDSQNNLIFVNGAPELLLAHSTLKSSARKAVQVDIDNLTRSGHRVVAFARKLVPSSHHSLAPSEINHSLEWVGLLAFSDPVRIGIKATLAKVKTAGIKLLVITGDYPQTAISVMNSLDLAVSPSSVIVGSELTHLSPDALSAKIAHRQIALFARTTPDQKLKIVDALKKNGEVVAMMGDGVNDAPALKKADIGVVVGEATDLAKETADLVLLDSNFATVIAAIEEGRGIFDNLRKIILYLLCDSFEELIVVVAALIFNLPLPVTAAQILWINLVSDGFPDLALTVDPVPAGIMKQPPRSPRENLISPWMRRLIFLVSVTGGLVAFTLFLYFYRTTGNLSLARSITFATLGVNSLVYVFSIRTLKRPFWRENPLANSWLNLAVLGGLLLQFLPFATPATRSFFGLSALSPFHLLCIFGASLIMFIMIEVGKIYFRKH